MGDDGAYIGNTSRFLLVKHSPVLRFTNLEQHIVSPQ